MRYWVYMDGQVLERPFEEGELASIPGFNANTLVCVEGSQEWVPARLVIEAYKQPVPPPPPSQQVISKFASKTTFFKPEPKVTILSGNIFGNSSDNNEISISKDNSYKMADITQTRVNENKKTSYEDFNNTEVVSKQEKEALEEIKKEAEKLREELFAEPSAEQISIDEVEEIDVDDTLASDDEVESEEEVLKTAIKTFISTKGTKKAAKVLKAVDIANNKDIDLSDDEDEASFALPEVNVKHLDGDIKPLNSKPKKEAEQKTAEEENQIEIPEEEIKEEGKEEKQEEQTGEENSTESEETEESSSEEETVEETNEPVEEEFSQEPQEEPSEEKETENISDEEFEPEEEIFLDDENIIKPNSEEESEEISEDDSEQKTSEEESADETQKQEETLEEKETSEKTKEKEETSDNQENISDKEDPAGKQDNIQQEANSYDFSMPAVNSDIIVETLPPQEEDKKDAENKKEDDALSNLLQDENSNKTDDKDKFLATFSSDIETVFLDQPTAFISDYIPPEESDNQNKEEEHIEQDKTSDKPEEILDIRSDKAQHQISLQNVKRVKPAAIKTVPMVDGEQEEVFSQTQIRDLHNAEEAMVQSEKKNTRRNLIKAFILILCMCFIVIGFLGVIAQLNILPKEFSPLHSLFTSKKEEGSNKTSKMTTQEIALQDLKDAEKLHIEQILNEVKNYQLNEGITLDAKVKLLHPDLYDTLEWAAVQDPTDLTYYGITIKAPTNPEGYTPVNYRFNYNTVTYSVEPTTSEATNLMFQAYQANK